jgi:hypothetical protein
MRVLNFSASAALVKSRLGWPNFKWLPVDIRQPEPEKIKLRFVTLPVSA